MGNCCASLCGRNNKLKAKPQKLAVLKKPTGRVVGHRYGSESRDGCMCNEFLDPSLSESELEGEEFEITLERGLERGGYGATYLCKDRKTGEELVCKSISKKVLRTAIDIEDVRREVAIMRHLPKHPSIVSLMDIYEDDDDVHLVMELCKGGSLFDGIVARRHYSERAAASVIKTIIQVVQMCHEHGVMHRDIKPENFLFANNKEIATLKVTDFSSSIFFKLGERFTEIVGSTYYRAPEVFKRNYGPEIDIWSAGVILYILLCGVPPFWAEDETGVAQEVLRSVIDFKRMPWPNVSYDAKYLVKKMLDPDVKSRLTAQEVLDHPWLENAKTAPNSSLGVTARASLMQFPLMNKLKKTALMVITDHLSVEEVAGIKEGFQVMDTEYRGKINIDELREGLHKLYYKIPDEYVQILMEAGDVDKDGFLDFGEFVAISIHQRKISHDEFQRAFHFFDKNESGYIELEELHNSLADEVDTNSEEVINAIMHDVDTDKDGRISFEEFVAMMKADTYW